MRIYIKSLSNRIFDLDVEPSDTMQKVKAKYAETAQFGGINPDTILLVYAGRGLKNWHTVSYYNIPEGSTFHQVLNLRGGGLTTARTYVMSEYGDIMIPTYLQVTTSVGDLKDSAAGQLDTSPEHIHFVFNGAIRSNEEIIRDLGIQEDELRNYELHLERRFDSVGTTIKYNLKLVRH